MLADPPAARTAPIGAELHGLPIALPLLLPGERSLARDADLGRQIEFVHHRCPTRRRV